MTRIWFLLTLVACGSSSEPEKPPPPTHIETKIGPIKVTDHVPADAEMMCSVDYKVYPRAQIHVVPTFNADLGRYVGSYRCDDHWKSSIAETRARLARSPTKEEVGGFLQVFGERGVTEDKLRTFVAGKPLPEAATAALDALEAGRLVLDP